jgi:hypothetical protein
VPSHSDAQRFALTADALLFGHPKTHRQQARREKQQQAARTPQMLRIQWASCAATGGELKNKKPEESLAQVVGGFSRRTIREEKTLTLRLRAGEPTLLGRRDPDRSGLPKLRKRRVGDAPIRSHILRCMSLRTG